MEKESGKKALLFCSQGSYWNCFETSDIILKELNKSCFSSIYNMETIQEDDYSCGNFSIVSMLLLPCFDFDVKKTAKAIGMNGKNLGSIVGKPNKIDIYTMRKSLFGTKNE